MRAPRSRVFPRPEFRGLGFPTWLPRCGSVCTCSGCAKTFILTANLLGRTILQSSTAAKLSPHRQPSPSFSAKKQASKENPMRRTYLIGVFLWFTAAFVWSQPNPRPEVAPGGSDMPAVHASNDDARTQARILEQYGKLPLSFEANHGQTDRRVKFLSRTSAYSLFLTGDEAVLTLRGKNADANRAKIAWKPGQAAPKAGGVLRMKLRNANPAAKVTGLDELAGKSNYFAGDDPAKWRPNVPTYAKVKYEEIYSGIDLVYYGNQRHLEYDFIMAPGADPHRIAFEVLGASRIRRNVHGDLVLKIGEGEIRWRKPVVYQEKDGARVEIATRYAITDTNRIGFNLAKYDASRPLYIDPLIYSTYLRDRKSTRLNS